MRESKSLKRERLEQIAGAATDFRDDWLLKIEVEEELGAGRRAHSSRWEPPPREAQRA